MKNRRDWRIFVSLAYFIIFVYGPVLESASLEETKRISSLRTLSAEELLAKVQSGQPVFLIDCRPPEEYCAGHVPRAANVSMDSFTFGKDTVLKKSIKDIQKQAGETLSFVLIDIESQEEYIPRSKLEQLVNHLPDDRYQEIIFYCRRPECTRSPMAIRWLEALGYKNVWRYEGGWQEWSEKSYPSEK